MSQDCCVLTLLCSEIQNSIPFKLFKSCCPFINFSTNSSVNFILKMVLESVLEASEREIE